MLNKIIYAALAVSVALAVIFWRVSVHEHAVAVAARAERDIAVAAREADIAAISELDSGAQEREIRYVEIVREVASAGPVSAECREDPAMRAAGAGVLRLRDAYCSNHPERCAVSALPHPGNRSAGD